MPAEILLPASPPPPCTPEGELATGPEPDGRAKVAAVGAVAAEPAVDGRVEVGMEAEAEAEAEEEEDPDRI